MASFRMRLIVGDLELKVGRDIAEVESKSSGMKYYGLGSLGSKKRSE